MPEYLAPGVYLEEIDTVPNAIPDVPTSTLDFVTAQRLVALIRPVIEETNPEWRWTVDPDFAAPRVRSPS